MKSEVLFLGIMNVMLLTLAEDGFVYIYIYVCVCVPGAVHAIDGELGCLVKVQDAIERPLQAYEGFHQYMVPIRLSLKPRNILIS